MDSFQGQDPYDGDGYMAKGRHMQMQVDCSKSDVLQQYLKAMAQYRCAQALHIYQSLLGAVCMLSMILFHFVNVGCTADHMLERHVWQKHVPEVDTV